MPFHTEFDARRRQTRKRLFGNERLARLPEIGAVEVRPETLNRQGSGSSSQMRRRRLRNRLLHVHQPSCRQIIHRGLEVQGHPVVMLHDELRDSGPFFGWQPFNLLDDLVGTHHVDHHTGLIL